RFDGAHLPAWVDISSKDYHYGFPDIESRGFKIALDAHGPVFDPDAGDRRITDQALVDVRAYLARRFPDLAQQPLAESRVCPYENTDNGDLLIDRHPDWSNAWLVGGGSGHGFKQGPAVGRYVADLVLGAGQPEPRFALASHKIHGEPA
ncbi:MAG: FAD-dependent oxidoreductase, partial [Proteobacteria bacterium]|nr:FAD-dependent oxidoreductase [Pseudomonadota bacterium]